MKIFKKVEKREQFKKFEAKDTSFLKKILGGEEGKDDVQASDQKVKL